jgi:DNA-directed RNA polymerase specialized sigma24 family protein
MVPSSRTPEGSPNRCPVCGNFLCIEPSQPPGDAPCPACGHLLWFLRDDVSPLELLQAADAQPLRDQLDPLLSCLPPLDRQVIELRLQGRSNEECAAELEVAVRTVRRVIERVRALAQKGEAP